jgi:uncharacterized membrane protein YgaE (UPF0421/DUF939 family)
MKKKIAVLIIIAGISMAAFFLDRIFDINSIEEMILTLLGVLYGTILFFLVFKISYKMKPHDGDKPPDKRRNIL